MFDQEALGTVYAPFRAALVSGVRCDRLGAFIGIDFHDSSVEDKMVSAAVEEQNKTTNEISPVKAHTAHTSCSCVEPLFEASFWFPPRVIEP